MAVSQHTTRRALMAGGLIALSASTVQAEAPAVSPYAEAIRRVEILRGEVRDLLDGMDAFRSDTSEDFDQHGWDLHYDTFIRAQADLTQAKTALYDRVLTDAGVPIF